MLRQGALLLQHALTTPFLFLLTCEPIQRFSARQILTTSMDAARNEPHSGDRIMENLRRRTCVRCGSERIAPYFAIEQIVRPPFRYEHAIVSMCPDCRGGQLERTYRDSADPAEILDQSEWYSFDESSMDAFAVFIRHKIVQTAPGRRLSPCPEPLSPTCLCDVHWQLAEAAGRLEPLSDEEMGRRGEAVDLTFAMNASGLPEFKK